jgi:dTDP-4-dehydrorhamnose 3,5-epimerase
MRVIPTELPGVLVIEPEVHRDSRGFLVETWHAPRYARLGIEGPFIQDNHTKSVGGTLRGLHLQVAAAPQAKLVRVVEGEVFDVAVDVRRGSPTFGRWVGVTLAADNFRQCYIPSGFAHGFAVTSAVAQVEYKCSAVYDPAAEIGIAWNDATLAIGWPIADPVLSDRDRRNPPLAALTDRLPLYSATDL